MDFNNMSDEQLARVLRQYQRHHENQQMQRENASTTAGMMAGFLIILGGIAVCIIPGDFGLTIGGGCFVIALVLVILSKIGSAIGNFGDHHHNPLD